MGWCCCAALLGGGGWLLCFGVTGFSSEAGPGVTSPPTSGTSPVRLGALALLCQSRVGFLNLPLFPLVSAPVPLPVRPGFEVSAAWRVLFVYWLVWVFGSFCVFGWGGGFSVLCFIWAFWLLISWLLQLGKSGCFGMGVC